MPVIKTIVVQFFFINTLLVFVTACSTESRNKASDHSASKPTAQPLHDEEAVMSALYQQHAAEYHALCLQAYNIAKLRLDQELTRKKKVKSLPITIVTDLDETALDNSSYYGWLYKHNTTFTEENWSAWCQVQKADSVPGSVSFFKYADSKGVQVFYISNRDASLLTCTINNMKALGFPQTEPSHFLFRYNTGSKEERRKKVAQKHKILLLLGDNLNDFSFLFEHKNSQDRKQQANADKNLWGTTFIVFPNAVYGDWENALYHYNYSLTLAQKDSIRQQLLRSYAQ